MEEVKFGKKDMKCVHVTVVGKYANAFPSDADSVRYDEDNTVKDAIDGLKETTGGNTGGIAKLQDDLKSVKDGVRANLSYINIVYGELKSADSGIQDTLRTVGNEIDGLKNNVSLNASFINGVSMKVDTHKAESDSSIAGLRDDLDAVDKELKEHKQEFTDFVVGIDGIINGGAKDVIDSFKDVTDFLAGVKDTETLSGKLMELKDNIDGVAETERQHYMELDTYRREQHIAIGSLEGSVRVAVDDIDGLKNDVGTLKSNLSYTGGMLGELERDVAKKQAILISGENIKTINGESILGEGDLVVNTKVNPNLMMNTGFHGDITQVWNTDVKTNSYNPRTDVDGVRNLVLSNGQYIQQDVDCNPGVYTLSFRMKASGSYVPMYLWDVASGYDVNVLAKSEGITQRSGVGEYRIYTEGSEYKDYFITFEVEYSSPALEIKFGGNTTVPWVYISAIKLEEGDVVTQYVSHVDDYASAYGNSGESFSGDAADVSYAGNVNASNVKDALDLLSTTMITTEPAEGEEVTDYVLMASDVEQSLGDSTKPISQAAVKSAINSIESMIVSVINTPT